MKNVIIPLASLLLLSGCRSNSGKGSTEQQTAEANFRKAIHGGWVNAEYANILSATLSPMKAKDSMGITSLHDFYINATEKGDSLVIMGLGPQGEIEMQEYTLVLYFKPGLTPTSFPVKITGPVRDTTIDSLVQELSYEIKGTDTTLFINNYNDKQKLISSQRFIKVSGATHSPGNYLDNKIILAGNYTYTNDSGKVAEASFTPDGQVSGMGNYNAYSIGSNFGEDAPRFDYLYISPGTDEDMEEDIRTWGYARQGDSLLLYYVKPGKYPEPAVREGVKYVLVRKR